MMTYYTLQVRSSDFKFTKRTTTKSLQYCIYNIISFNINYML